MKRIPLYIDTDMGVDDIVAICLLTQNSRYDIRGISLVNGVTTVQKGIQNAQRLLRALDVPCPIFVGANRTQQKSSIQFPQVDRARASSLDLLRDVPLPSKGSNPVLPITALPEWIKKESARVTLVCIGPLTNLPPLLRDPSFKKKVQMIYIMGGALRCAGNVCPRFISEYNFRLDPQAAQNVLTIKLPIILVPMDATKYVPTRPRLATGQTLRNLQRFYQVAVQIRPPTLAGRIMQAIILNNSSDFDYFYDPLVAGILIDPSIVTKLERFAINVRVKGQSIGKITTTIQRKPNIDVVTSVSGSKLYKLILRCIKQRSAL
ncbi:MAG: nucleoside hydrolase [Patescibacteria group bacterium]